MSRFEAAKAFCEAHETGKGWDGVNAVCQNGAPFFCQAVAVHGTQTAGEVGAVPPAVRSVMSHDAYVQQINGEKSGHMSKTCNNVLGVLGVRGLGWA